MEGILKMETQRKQTDTTDGNVTKRIIEMENLHTPFLIGLFDLLLSSFLVLYLF